MAYKINNRFKIGNKVITTRKIECMTGVIEKGDEVVILEIGDRGYGLVSTSLPNIHIIECGWDCIKEEELNENS